MYKCQLLCFMNQSCKTLETSFLDFLENEIGSITSALVFVNNFSSISYNKAEWL